MKETTRSKDVAALAAEHGVAELARLTGYSEDLVRKWRSGARAVSAEAQLRLREAFPEFSADAELRRRIGILNAA